MAHFRHRIADNDEGMAVMGDGGGEGAFFKLKAFYETPSMVLVFAVAGDDQDF